MDNSQLVIITSHYPYGNGEGYLKDELKIAENYFDRILIFCLDKYAISTNRYVPKNSVIIQCRSRKISFKNLLLSFLKLVTGSTLSELAFSSSVYNVCIIKKIKQLIVDNYIVSILEDCSQKSIIEYTNTVFYSYWLSSTAKFLVDLKKRHPEAIYVSRAHGGDCFVDRGYQSYRREILAGLDAIYSISKAGADDLKTNFSKYLPNYKTIRINRLGIIKDNSYLNKFCFTKDFIRIVSCSNIIELKRLDLIINSLSLIDFCFIEWIHFGDGKLKENMEEYANSVLKNNIEFTFLGHVSNHEIHEYYRTHSVDLFINASDAEGIPVSIMEAYSYGIPAIARDVGGNNEIVENGRNGFLLEKSCSPRIIYNSIKKYFYLNMKEKQNLRNDAYDTYKEKFNAEKNYSEFFLDILGLINEK